MLPQTPLRASGQSLLGRSYLRRAAWTHLRGAGKTALTHRMALYHGGRDVTPLKVA